MRHAHWILWLMLALLPVRGWAMAGMTVPMVAVQAAALPCHQAERSEEGSASDAGACQACDWCHAAMGLAPRVVTAAASLPSDAPAAAVERDTGRAAVNGLERPPRTDLAR